LALIASDLQRCCGCWLQLFNNSITTVQIKQPQLPSCTSAAEHPESAVGGLKSESYNTRVSGELKYQQFSILAMRCLITDSSND
jgi:hypothetical protein